MGSDCRLLQAVAGETQRARCHSREQGDCMRPARKPRAIDWIGCGAFVLKFTVGGFRTEYSSKRPRYEEILAAVRGGQPVQAWVSTKQETLFPRRGWVPLYKLRLDGKIVLDYDTTVAEKADRDRPLLILGCIVLG